MYSGLIDSIMLESLISFKINLETTLEVTALKAPTHVLKVITATFRATIQCTTVNILTVGIAFLFLHNVLSQVEVLRAHQLLIPLKMITILSNH